MNKSYSNLRHGTERKGRSEILEREIFNLQNKNPWEGLLETSKKSSVKLQKKKTTTTTTTTTKIRSKTENRMQNRQNI